MKVLLTTVIAISTIALAGFFMIDKRAGKYKDFAGDISPDGSKIVFYSYRDGNSEIYIMDGDGSNQTRLTDSPAREEFPIFSPDGSKIIFSSTRDSDKNQMDAYMMNPDGTGVQRLTQGDKFYAPRDWVGNYIYYSNWWKSEDKSSIYSISANGSDNLPIIENIGGFADFSVSADGFKLAFTAKDESGNQDIWVIDTDGSNKKRLTNHAARDDWAAISPDGQHAVFISTRNRNNEVYLVKTDGSEPAVNISNSRKSEEYFPSFTPDGKRIIFDSDRDGETNVFTMNLDGSDWQNISGKK